MVVHALKSSTWQVEEEDQEFEDNLRYKTSWTPTSECYMRLCLKKKKKTKQNQKRVP